MYVKGIKPLPESRPHYCFSFLREESNMSTSFRYRVTLQLTSVLFIRKLLKCVFSCEDAAQQVLMSVCPSVRGQVVILPMPRFPKVAKGYPRVAQGYRRLPKVTQGYLRLLKVGQGSTALHELACSHKSLYAVKRDCMQSQLHELACSYISFHTVT